MRSYLAPMNQKKNSQTRLIVASALCAAALLASFAMSKAANQREKYWVVLKPVAVGTQLEPSDIGFQMVALGSSGANYLGEQSNPIGSITRRPLSVGDLLEIDSLTDNSSAMVNQQLSISLRNVDIPSTLQVGEVVTIFQLHDASNGESALEPNHVLSGVFIVGLDRKGSNFGGEAALTISVNRDTVLELLAATTSGRLVIVRSHG